MSLWKAHGLPEPITEHRFHPFRRWRFDYAWPDSKIAVEIEGGIWNRGAHVRGMHYMSDMEKYNEAQKMGWQVYRFTPKQFKDGHVFSLLLDIFK